MFGRHEMKRIIRFDLTEAVEEFCELRNIRYTYTCAEETEFGVNCRLWTFYLPKECFAHIYNHLRSEIRRIEKENPRKH